MVCDLRRLDGGNAEMLGRALRKVATWDPWCWSNISKVLPQILTDKDHVWAEIRHNISIGFTVYGIREKKKKKKTTTPAWNTGKI